MPAVINHCFEDSDINLIYFQMFVFVVNENYSEPVMVANVISHDIRIGACRS